MNSRKDRMRDLFRIENAESALSPMLAVVPDPCLAEYNAPESPIRIIPAVFSESRAGFDLKRVRRSPHSYDRLPRLHIIRDVLHLIVRQIAKPSQDHCQVGGVKRLQAGDIIQLLWVDCAILLIDGEEDCAAKAIVSRQDFGQL